MSICTSLDLYFKMDPLMLENQVKESQSRVVSHHPPRWGMGCYTLSSSKSLSTFDSMFLRLYC